MATSIRKFSPTSTSAAEDCLLAGAFHAATFLFAALGFLVFGMPRAAAGAALVGVLLWAASTLHWGVLRLAQRRWSGRVPVMRRATDPQGLAISR